jgi:hypothetical protein
MEKTSIASRDTRTRVTWNDGSRPLIDPVVIERIVRHKPKGKKK